MRTTTGFARYGVGNEFDVLWTPRKTYAVGELPGIIYCHGASSLGRDCLSSTIGYRPVVAQITGQANYLLAFADIDFTKWGRDSTMDAITALYNWLVSPTGGGARTGQVALIGASMGGLNEVNWAYRNPTLVSCISLIIPALDLQDIYVNDRGPGLQATIQAVWGGAPPYSTRSPMNLASSLSAIPQKIWYASDDPVTPNAATNTTYAASVGANCTTRNMGAVGHTVGAVDPSEVLAFVAAHHS